MFSFLRRIKEQEEAIDHLNNRIVNLEGWIAALDHVLIVVFEAIEPKARAELIEQLKGPVGRGIPFEPKWLSPDDKQSFKDMVSGVLQTFIDPSNFEKGTDDQADPP